MSCFKKISDIVDHNQVELNGSYKIASLAPKIAPIAISRERPTNSCLWEETARKMGIQSLYRGASLDNCPLIPSAIVELGRKWVDTKKRPSLYLHGNTGSGKTYFATAIYRAMVEKRHPWIIFVKACDLDDELLTAIQDNQELTKLNKYSEVPILFLDDLGVERPSPRMLRQLYAIIDKRVGQQLTTVITSNAARGELDLGDRIISRLEHFYSIEFPKKDIRKTLDLPHF